MEQEDLINVEFDVMHHKEEKKQTVWPKMGFILVRTKRLYFVMNLYIHADKRVSCCISKLSITNL